jgi:cytochrome b561
MDRNTTDMSSTEILAMEYYDAPTLLFHWLTVLFVVVLFGTSLLWIYVTPRDRFWRPLLEGTHVSLGILFAILILGRIVWRVTGMRRYPAETGISGVLSRIMYLILYVLLVAEIVTGFVLRWLQGESFQFFGLFSIPALVAPDRASAYQFEEIHNWIGWAIVLLSAGHAAAALVHHYVLKDQVLARMLHRRRANPVRAIEL